MERRCAECQRDEDETLLWRCPVCFAYCCEDHAHKMGGRNFCSKGCAVHFFFDDADEEG